jgi:hypothetical protein
MLLAVGIGVLAVAAAAFLFRSQLSDLFERLVAAYGPDGAESVALPEPLVVELRPGVQPRTPP